MLKIERVRSFMDGSVQTLRIPGKTRKVNGRIEVYSAAVVPVNVEGSNQVVYDLEYWGLFATRALAEATFAERAMRTFKEEDFKIVDR